MSKRRILLAGLASLMLTGALILLWPSDPPEPIYKGNTLSQWVLGLHGNLSEEQGKALVAMGTNSFPHLFKWITYDTPKWKLGLYKPTNWLRSLVHKGPITDRRQILADRATDALWWFKYHSAIRAECLRLSASTDTPPNVRRRVNWLLFASAPNDIR